MEIVETSEDGTMVSGYDGYPVYLGTMIVFPPLPEPFVFLWNPRCRVVRKSCENRDFMATLHKYPGDVIACIYIGMETLRDYQYLHRSKSSSSFVYKPILIARIPTRLWETIK